MSIGIARVVECIYEDLERTSPSSWLARVLAAIGATLPDTVNGVAYAYDFTGAADAWSIARPVVDRAGEALADGVYESFLHAPPEFRRSLFPAMAPAGTYSEVMRSDLTQQHDVGARVAKDLEVADAIYVNARNPDERGVLLAFNVAAPRRLSRAERRRLSLLSAHVAAGRRLLPALASLAQPAAVIAPSGRAEHVDVAHESSLGVLRDRVVRLERARRAKTDGDVVLAHWQALVRGTYTLVDRFESDGRRFVVAYPNAPGARDPRGLTEREAAVATWACRGHSQKLIAYELGISLGAVGALMARVRQRLGVSSHAELVERLAQPADVEVLGLPDRQELLVFSRPTTALSLPADVALTASERAVAEAVLRGLAPAEIARARATSEKTVANQLTSLYRKLGVGSRAELLARAAGGATPEGTS